MNCNDLFLFQPLRRNNYQPVAPPTNFGPSNIKDEETYREMVATIGRIWSEFFPKPNQQNAQKPL